MLWSLGLLTFVCHGAIRRDVATPLAAEKAAAKTAVAEKPAAAKASAEKPAAKASAEKPAAAKAAAEKPAASLQQKAAAEKPAAAKAAAEKPAVVKPAAAKPAADKPAAAKPAPAKPAAEKPAAVLAAAEKPAAAKATAEKPAASKATAEKPAVVLAAAEKPAAAKAAAEKPAAEKVAAEKAAAPPHALPLVVVKKDVTLWLEFMLAGVGSDESCANRTAAMMDELHHAYTRRQVPEVLRDECKHFLYYERFGSDEEVCYAIVEHLIRTWDSDQDYERWCKEAYAKRDAKSADEIPTRSKPPPPDGEYADVEEFAYPNKADPEKPCHGAEPCPPHKASGDHGAPVGAGKREVPVSSSAAAALLLLAFGTVA